MRFKAEGARLIEPQSYKGKDADQDIVKVELVTGGPISGQVLVVNNNFVRTLGFRVLERLQNKSEFAKFTKNVIKIGPGKKWCHFTPEQNPIAEAVLYQFTLTDEHLSKKEE